MNKTAIKRFVTDNKVPLAFIAGATACALVVHVYYKDKTMLELTASAIKRMKENGVSVVYDVPKEGLFALTIVPE